MEMEMEMKIERGNENDGNANNYNRNGTGKSSVVGAGMREVRSKLRLSLKGAERVSCLMPHASCLVMAVPARLAASATELP